MSDMERSDIADRLIKLETLFEERGKAHDKRADERWTDLMDKLHELKSSRNCVEHAGLLIKIDKRVEGCEKWQTVVNWAVGVIYVALVGYAVHKILG